MFQFLIGRLKTRDSGEGNTQTTAFQFLIGRLKTKENKIRLLYGSFVSIPHR